MYMAFEKTWMLSVTKTLRKIVKGFAKILVKSSRSTIGKSSFENNLFGDLDESVPIYF